MIGTRSYERGTSLTMRYPWGSYIAGSALCADGKVRKLVRLSSTAYTFFSVPAAVQVKGKTVSGYITIDTDDAGNEVVFFIRYNYGKNAAQLPEGKAA